MASNSPQQKTALERITEIADLIHLSTESMALLDKAQIELNLTDLKVWYFKNYVKIGSAFVVEYIAYLNREKEKQLAQDAQQIETEAQK